MIINFTDQPYEDIAPGVRKSWMQPGGKDGPDGAVLEGKTLGGTTFSESWSLGTPEDAWRFTIPDIRMPANQIWPMHWHDCWTAVAVLEGGLLIGDWWMEPGDMLIAAPSVEYGLLLVGPQGCEVLEIFARDILSPGGYAPEFHDHPALVHIRTPGQSPILARPPGSEGNAGSQVVPVDGTPGLAKHHLDGNGYWDLGDPGDPERGVLMDRKLAPGTSLGSASYGDWRGSLVLDGSMTVGGRELVKDDLLIAEPGAAVPTISVGAQGVHLLTCARTAAACDPAEIEKTLAHV
jgi:hypothetical protein